MKKFRYTKAQKQKILRPLKVLDITSRATDDKIMGEITGLVEYVLHQCDQAELRPTLYIKDVRKDLRAVSQASKKLNEALEKIDTESFQFLQETMAALDAKDRNLNETSWKQLVYGDQLLEAMSVVEQIHDAAEGAKEIVDDFKQHQWTKDRFRDIGRQPRPESGPIKLLIVGLAAIFHAHTGKLPTRGTYNPHAESPQKRLGLFCEFCDFAIPPIGLLPDPQNLNALDHWIREGIKEYKSIITATRKKSA